MGFFIAGSTIRELNGVYKRVEQVRRREAEADIDVLILYVHVLNLSFPLFHTHARTHTYTHTHVEGALTNRPQVSTCVPQMAVE